MINSYADAAIRCDKTRCVKVSKHKFTTQQIVSKKRVRSNRPVCSPDVNDSKKGYQYNGIHFDSSWELAYYIWLSDNGKAFIYHPPFYLEYTDDTAMCRQYQPDFLVEGKFIEIKGDQFFNEKGEPYNHYEKAFWWNKYNALLANGVEILRFEKIREYLRYIKKRYGKRYLQSFKKR